MSTEGVTAMYAEEDANKNVPDVVEAHSKQDGTRTPPTPGCCERPLPRFRQESGKFTALFNEGGSPTQARQNYEGRKKSTHQTTLATNFTAQYPSRT
eukprot:1177640-Prorocentrum_minimum.AAC.3